MTNRDQQDWYERLLANFTSQEQIHARMLEAIDESEDALRTGRMEQFVESCRRQQSRAAIVARIAEVCVKSHNNNPIKRYGKNFFISNLFKINKTMKAINIKVKYLIFKSPE